MSMSYQPAAPGGDSLGSAASANEPLSLIDRNSSIEGTFTTSRDVRVEGIIRGKIICEGLLYIAESADIDATVEAANVTVAGKLTGEVLCRGRLQITSTGRMSATVTTDSLVIDEGAFYEGDLNMKTSALAATSGSADEGSSSVLHRLSGTEERESSSSSDPRRGSAST